MRYSFHRTVRALAPELAVGALALTSLAAQAAPDYCPDDGPVRFGVEPYEAPKLLLPAYQRVAQLLQQKIGCEVKIQITSNYTAEIEAMRHDKLDVGEFGPFGAVLAEKVANAKIIAQFADENRQPQTYWASIVTWPGSGIDKLADVKGKTFVYSDPASTSGHLMPAYALKQAGIDPEHGVQAFYAGTHTSSFEALAYKKGKAGELNSETKAMAERRGWLAGTDFKTLWKSKPLPLDAIAINPRINDTLAAKLTQTLQHLDYRSSLNAEQQKTMKKKMALVPADHDDYAPIRKVMNTMHIGLSDL